MTDQIEKIRVGMIGVGGIAQGHVQRMLALPEVEIVALADASEKSLENTKTRLQEDGTLTPPSPPAPASQKGRERAAKRKQPRRGSSQPA